MTRLNGRTLSVLAVVLALNLLLYMNCSGGLSSNSRGESASASSINDFFSAFKVIEGQYLEGDFALATNSIFRPFNADLIPNLIFFVDSERGQDSSPGTLDRPLKSLEGAQLAVRAALKENARRNIAVVLSGTFFIAHTLSFTEADSAADGYFVTWLSDAKNPATLSGAKSLEGSWTLVDEGRKVYGLNVGSLTFRRLFVNGQEAKRASKRVLGLATIPDDGRLIQCESCGLPAITEPQSIELVKDVQWIEDRCPGVLNPDHTINVSAACAGQFARGKNIWGRDMSVTTLENSMSLISGPGEWALDSNRGQLYYRPPENETIETATLLVPQTTRLLALNGARNIAFHHLKFTATDWQQAAKPEGLSINQADETIARKLIPAAVTCEGCHGILFLSSEFYELGTGAIHIGAGSSDNLIFQNHFHNISGSAVRIGEDPILAENTSVERTTVEDNLIELIGEEYHSSPAIFQIYAAHSRIAHNEIHDVPYTAISVGWGWTTTESANSHDNHIEANHIYRATQILTDGGGVYTLSAQQGTLISRNYIHDLGSGPESLHAFIFSNGVYLDNGSSYITVTGNCIVNVPTLDVFVNTPSIGNVSETPSASDCEAIKSDSGRRSLPLRLGEGERLAFGGLYGSGYAGGATIAFPNFATKEMSCPAGYTASRMLGTTNVDYDLTLCFKKLKKGEAADYDFGGFFSTNSLDRIVFTNPFTGQTTCPDAYTKVQALGTTGVDNNLFYCIRPHRREEYKFYGLFGYRYEMGRTVRTPNPATGLTTCPSGSTGKMVYGQLNVDYNLMLCTD